MAIPVVVETAPHVVEALRYAPPQQSPLAMLQPTVVSQVPDNLVQLQVVEDKDFPNPDELFTEIYTSQGIAECVIYTGDKIRVSGGVHRFPLWGELRLRIRHRHLPGCPVLWYLIVPLGPVRRSLEAPPFEWDGWIGVWPVSQDLEAWGADVAFEQAIHLISKKEVPKLRLRLQYQDNLQAQRIRQEKDAQQKKDNEREHGEVYGQQRFKELQQLRSRFGPKGRDPQSAGKSIPVAVEVEVSLKDSASSPPAKEETSHITGLEKREATAREALQAAMACLVKVREAVAGAEGQKLSTDPPLPTVEEILASGQPSKHLERHFQQLQRRVDNALVGEADLAEAIAVALQGVPDQSICPDAHPLIPMGISMDDGWTCDGQHRPGGCKSGITGYHQSKGKPRYRCGTCDYDLCQACHDVLSYPVPGAAIPKSEKARTLKSRWPLVGSRLQEVARVTQDRNRFIQAKLANAGSSLRASGEGFPLRASLEQEIHLRRINSERDAAYGLQAPEGISTAPASARPIRTTPTATSSFRLKDTLGSR